MLSCIDMYKISERLSRAKGSNEFSFGKLSMIFAGDFAQLPPIRGESASLYSRRKMEDVKTYNGHCAVIGKSLWHQITHVVILRKNMRNTGESDHDVAFRRALENMRYKACTGDDIRFLNTLVSSPMPRRPYIGRNPWRKAAILVGENKLKDEINRLGCIRYGNDIKQELTVFFSDDTISSKAHGDKGRKSRIGKKSTINTISKELQTVLWDLPPCAHDLHAPSTLSLCHGLPVIIRYNTATELCITKGQRGTVYAWHETKGTFGQRVLDVLFVLLNNPPSSVNIPGLPLNVVPLTRRKTSAHIQLPDDSMIWITRNQVDILPGFSMTAHASQGQSLSPNAADLNTLSDHHGIYTALSRSRSADNTVILQGFDSSKITGGASGQLRREYRELEMLDDITRLRFEGKLPSTVLGSTRNVLIESYLAWKGINYTPSNIHESLKWSNEDPYIIDSEPYVPWTILDKAAFTKILKNKQNLDLPLQTPSATSIISNTIIPKKRNVGDLYVNENDPLPPLKRLRPSIPARVVSMPNTTLPTKIVNNSRRRATDLMPIKSKRNNLSSKPPTRRSSRIASRNLHTVTPPCNPSLTTSPPAPAAPSLPAPIGLRWSNNSCAFDAIFTILRLIWSESSHTYTDYKYLQRISHDFHVNIQTNSTLTLETARDDFRRILAVDRPRNFPFGAYCAVVEALQYTLALKKPFMTTSLICAQGHRARRQPWNVNDCVVTGHRIMPQISTNQWLSLNPPAPWVNTCATCNGVLVKAFKINFAPPVIAVSCEGNPDLAIDLIVKLPIHGQQDPSIYDLKGVIYWWANAAHFTCRIITNENIVYRHDGMSNDGAPIRESISAENIIFRFCDSAPASVAVYSKRLT